MQTNWNYMTQCKVFGDTDLPGHGPYPLTLSYNPHLGTLNFLHSSYIIKTKHMEFLLLLTQCAVVNLKRARIG